jgi:hypothetical protein
MKLYHTIPFKELPRIELVDYNGYRPGEVIYSEEEGRFRKKERAIEDYKKKLRETIKECQKRLDEADKIDDIDIEENMIW